jgi:CRP/FNR family transcriptional regulator, cyclic AMP receptor protein
MVLSTIPPFSELAPAEAQQFAARAVMRQFGRGEMIVRAGDPGCHLLVVTAGTVRLRLETAERRLVVAELRPCESFGELAVLDGRPHALSAVTVGSCTLLLLPADDVLQAVSRHRIVALSLLSATARRARRLEELLRDAALLDLRARVAHLLLELADSPAAQQPGAIPTTVQSTQEELAARVGATRESVNRCLRFYREHGLIHYGYGRVTVLQPEALRMHAGCRA